jgi:hypothetical protein
MDNFCWTCKFTLKVNLGWLIVLGLGKARAKLECFSQKSLVFTCKAGNYIQWGQCYKTFSVRDLRIFVLY